MINCGKANDEMKKINWKAGAALLIACVMGLAPCCAAAAPDRVIPLTAGVFFLLAQDVVELPAGSAGASLQTAKLSVDLLRLCSQPSFGEKDREDVEQLAQKALDSMTPMERELFLNTFEDRIVPFCDGLFAGDEACLDLLEDAGTDTGWNEEEAEENGDQERWEILKEAVLSLAD